MSTTQADTQLNKNSSNTSNGVKSSNNSLSGRWAQGGAADPSLAGKPVKKSRTSAGLQ